MNVLSKILRNKVFLYLGSRYIVYALQFIVLLMLANRLGPYNYGRWGFFLLICGYFRVINFGIPNSVDVYLVQNRNDDIVLKDYVMSSFGAVFLQCLLIVFLALSYFLVPLGIFAKYKIGVIFYAICFIGAIYYFNAVFGKIYRFRNRLLELSINQSLVPVLILFVTLIFKGEQLFIALVCVYVFAQVFSMILYLFRGAIPFGGQVRKSFVQNIYKKGFFLFLYNSCFYLIMTTTSTVVSYSYSVEEYGFYTFSYSLGHSVLLLLDSFTSISFPKLLDRFYRGSVENVQSLIRTIRINYVSLSHGLMYLAYAFFPLFITFFPKYSAALPALCLTALSVLLNTNAFGYNTYLIANNEEKVISIFSIVSLFVNVTTAIILVSYGVPFFCVVFSMMCSYLLFSFLCAWKAKTKLGEHFSIIGLIQSVLPFSLLIPYLVGVVIALLGKFEYSFFPLLVFCVLNINGVKSINATIKSVLNRPKIVDL